MGRSKFRFLGIFFLTLIFININAIEKRRVMVGVFDHKPLIFMDNNEAKGFYAELLNHIAKKENWEIIYKYGSWKDCMEGIKSNNLDLITSVAYTSERESFMDFSHLATITVWGQLYTNKRVKLNNLFDLKNRSVAIMENDFSGNYFKNMCNNLNINVIFIEVPSFTHIFNLLESKQVFAGVTNNVYGYENESTYFVNRTPIIFNPFQLYFSVKKGENQELLATLDRYFSVWKDDNNSIYYKSLNSWLSPVKSNEDNNLTKTIKMLIIILCSLLICAFLVILFYRIRVKHANIIIKSKNADIQNMDTELLKTKEEMFFKEKQINQLALAIEQINESVLITDLKGDVIYANPTFFKMHKIEPELNKDKIINVLKLLNLNDLKKRNMFDNLLAGISWKGIIPIVRNDNSVIMTENIITPIKNNEGELVQLIGIASDVTHQLKMQDQFKQMQKMEAVGQLAGGIAHDLNNVLTPILGYVEIALIDSNIDNELTEDLIEIKKSSLKAKSLIQQLLAFSRKQILKMEVINLVELVFDIEKMLKRLIRENILIKIHTQNDIYKIKADQTQLQQIIINLCVNAQDAIFDDGEILIDISNVFINETYKYQHSEMQQGNYVLLSISDNGFGIPKENIERIFEPFFTTKEIGKGTGLGLSTVFGIVKQHKGFIYVYSEEKIGTTFKIYLPVTEEENIKALENQVFKIPDIVRNECIIIAEDDEDIKKFIYKALKSIGYDIILSDNPSHCLELIKQNKDKLNLLITDIIMPQMNGLQLYQKAKNILPVLNVLYMSGYEETILAPDFSLDPNLVYLSKPFTFEMLCDKINLALKK